MKIRTKNCIAKNCSVMAEHSGNKFVAFTNKPAFTIVEVSILFVIFLIVAFLVAPLSLDDTMQVKNVSRWRAVQNSFSNIFFSINAQKENDEFVFDKNFDSVLLQEIKADIKPYRLTFLNGSYPTSKYRFTDFKQTQSNAVISYKLENEVQTDGSIGLLMYDVNGTVGPNMWGRDVFGYVIYQDHFETFCKRENIETQKNDCSKTGTGVCCSNWYLIGGSLK